MIKHCEILLRDADYLGEDMQPVYGCSIAIQDGRIARIIEKGEELPGADTIIDGSGLMWMPGFYDGHTHTSQQLLRGRLLDEKPVIWKRINVPFESRLTEESSRLSAKLAAVEMIKNGTVGFVDAGGKYVKEFAAVYEESGLRGRLTYMTNDSPHAPESLRTSVKETLERMEELTELCQGRLRAYYSLTTLPVVSEELLHQVFLAAIQHETPVEVHMNEYSSEVLDFMEHYGKRPFEYLESENLLRVPMIAPHSIFLSEEEMDIMQKRDVRVAHCPFSNCGKGIPPTPELLRRGIKTGFGTDGTAHGGSDVFREIRLFRSLMQVHWGVAAANSSVMPAATLLKMATRGGAQTLCQEDAGCIREGYAADLIAVNIDQAHLYPTQNIVNTLVESASGRDVVHTIADGRLLMKNREVLTLDEKAIWKECKELFEKEPFLNKWKCS